LGASRSLEGAEAPSTKENPMQVELVVFDVAGTTVVDDDYVALGLRDALRSEGVSIALGECAGVMGLPKPIALLALASGKVPADALAEVVRRSHAAFVSHMVEHYRSSPSVRAMPGAESTFRSLRAHGARIALDTGFSRPILDAILERLGWQSGVVDVTVASDEVEAGRPHPFMIQRAMTLLGVTATATVVKVGDTVADMREGLAARAGAVVGVLSGTGTRAELELAGATEVIPDLTALPRLLYGGPRVVERVPRALRAGHATHRR
jgi:phosphonatase-like hydrolase